MMQKKNFYKFMTPFVFGGLLAISFQAVGQDIKLNPITPGAQKLNNQLTDEQQAILAVRKAKASVVNIVGTVNVSGDPQKPIDNTFGTGFIISSDGYVVSNSHVVNDKEAAYSVVFADGQEHKAKVVGMDSYADIALLKIEGNNLPAAVLGDSNGLETGQSVFAIGNSLGRYQNAVTRGVVSGLGRDVSLDDENNNPRPRLKNLIQTDASINPGNSGGPVVNMLGEVVGMSTLVDRAGEGIGFAVPINEIKQVIPQLKTLGKVTRPVLGIAYQTITKSTRISAKLPVDSQGAYIISVGSNSPAALAGLMPKDIIIKINQQVLSEKVELDTVVSSFNAGNQILLTILRGSEIIERLVILGEYKQ